jgi:hypothetical protein
LSNLDFETLTKALTMPTEARHRLLVFNRLGWYFYYFGALGSMFVICLFAPGSDLASHVGLVFASICLVVPLSAAVRPIVGAWSILLCDRTELEVPESESPSSTLNLKHPLAVAHPTLLNLPTNQMVDRTVLLRSPVMRTKIKRILWNC